MRGIFIGIATILFTGTVTVTVIVHPVFSETWTASVDANITMTQYSYSDNWAD